jgi:hypothetical protein
MLALLAQQNVHEADADDHNNGLLQRSQTVIVINCFVTCTLFYHCKLSNYSGPM